MTIDFMRIGTNPPTPWPVMREASRVQFGEGNVWSDFTRPVSAINGIQSVVSELRNWNQFTGNPFLSIGTTLLKTLPSRLAGQELVVLLPETNERIVLITSDEIDGLPAAQLFTASIDRPCTTVDTFKDIVSSWRKHLAEHHFKGLNRRLEFIFEDEPEIGVNQTVPDTASFSAMMAYLAAKPGLKTPSIGFNRDGSFSAIWMGAKKLRVSLDFIGLENIRWVYVDSRNGIEKAITGAGTVTNKILNGVLDSYGAFDWMKV